MQNAPIGEGTENDKIKENVTKLWTDFAKSGNPNSGWPVAESANSLSYVEITDKIVPKDNFYKVENKLWDEIYAVLQA